MKGRIMIARIREAVNRPTPMGGAVNQKKLSPIWRDPEEGLGQPGLDVFCHERREHEEAPHAVDDGGHGCEQFDRDAEGAMEAFRADFGEEEGDAEADGPGDQQGKRGGDNGAGDGGKRAVDLRHRVPFCTGDEAEAERVEGELAAREHDDEDREQHRYDDRAGDVQADAERGVAKMETAVADGLCVCCLRLAWSCGWPISWWQAARAVSRRR